MSVDSVAVASPVGILRILSVDERITQVAFADGEPVPTQPPHSGALGDACRQLGEYFARERRDFDLPLSPRGTDFQLQVWEQLRRIPYGHTVSYGDIAAALGLPAGASRAVGLANGANPIAIVIPCHRVIGADGSLVGYGGGLARKRMLLDLESAASQPTLFDV